MSTIKIHHRFDAPIESVFDAVTDHELLASVPLVRSAKVVKPGMVEKNGLGAVREVDARVMFFREEITGFERPERMDYQIRYARPPFVHDGGSIRFEPDGGGTRVTWTSSFHSEAPVIGRLAGPAGAVLGGIAFKVVLLTLDRRLRRGARNRVAP